MSHDLEFQKVLYTEIDAAVSCDVEVHPPHNKTYPWVHIGESNSEDYVLGRTLFVDVHTWSTAEGSHETKSIQEQIRAALHGGTFTGGGFTFSCCRESDCRVFRDIDDETWHGVQTFRVYAT